MKETGRSIVDKISHATQNQFMQMKDQYKNDPRKIVQTALQTKQKKLCREKNERDRVQRLYDFEDSLCKGKCCVGLDEVGRGPLAGPLMVGAVVLPSHPHILGINDSKKLSPRQREILAPQIQKIALAWATYKISPHDIDRWGISTALKRAFAGAIASIDNKGILPDVVLIDGNPLHIDSREISVVHGDARCASIACASIIAKVARDAIMDNYARQYPHYHFDHNKGYGTPDHIQAIKTYGISPLHRKSFCTHFIS